jgi:hypothetical protein
MAAQAAASLSCSLPNLALFGRQAARHYPKYAQKLRLPTGLHVHIVLSDQKARQLGARRMTASSNTIRFVLPDTFDFILLVCATLLQFKVHIGNDSLVSFAVQLLLRVPEEEFGI